MFKNIFSCLWDVVDIKFNRSLFEPAGTVYVRKLMYRYKYCNGKNHYHVKMTLPLKDDIKVYQFLYV